MVCESLITYYKDGSQQRKTFLICAGVGVLLVVVGLCITPIVLSSEEHNRVKVIASKTLSNISHHRSTSLDPETGCPIGWLSTGAGCLMTESKTGMSWYDAAQFCEEEKGFIAELRSEEIIATINSFIKFNKENQKVNWWIGLTDIGHEGKWRWQHSCDELWVSSNWVGGSPSPEVTNNRKDCVLINTSKGLKWEDVDCKSKKYKSKAISVICQRDKKF